VTAAQVTASKRGAGKAYIIGAGLAGLSSAIRLSGRGVEVEVSDAAAHAGGRCRSYFDPQLGLTLDNGNHLVLSGNRAVMDYLAAIGAQDRLVGPAKAEFDFADLRSGEHWRMRPNEGPVPWWTLSQQRRPPATRFGEYLGLAGLMRPKPGRRIDQVMPCKGPLWDRLMQPFLLAALNTEPEAGDATLASGVIMETLAKGGRAYRPRIAEPTLGAAFIEPALETLAAQGARVRLSRRLRALTLNNDRVSALTFSDGVVELSLDDQVILATPPWIAADLIPGLSVPTEFRAIVNGHFRLAPPPGVPSMIGVIGGTVEWIFGFDNRISVTVSGADRLVEVERDALAAKLWQDVAAVYNLPSDLPPWQIVKEKRATFAATPEQNAKRPTAKTRWNNLTLAGDWVQTGLPATIEGALRSGEHAADLALTRLIV
jgi:squalene-associated FAD-dependent desaturase